MRDIAKEREIIIFGVGDIGTDLYNRLMEFPHNPVVCFCDNNPSKQGSVLADKEVFAPADAVNKYPGGTFVVTVINHKDAVKEQLLKLRVSEEQIIVFGMYDYINEEDKNRQEKKAEAYQKWCQIHNTKIRKLKKQYSGERCFIIGNGGSLTVHDLEMLKNEYTFGSNRLYKMFEKLLWRPTFYCFYDLQRVKKIKKDLPYILDNCDYLFTSSTIKDELCEEIIENKKTYFVHMEKEQYYPDLPKFSENVDERVYDGQTVLYMAAQIAVYLGFSQIYYLGADNHYSIELNLDGSIRHDATVKDYPQEIGGMELESSVIPQMELTTMSFEAVKEYALTHNIEVFNATRGGRLETFKRVNLDSLF